jgi:hypothetical protein
MALDIPLRTCLAETYLHTYLVNSKAHERENNKDFDD